jgi:hypothetical protein
MKTISILSIVLLLCVIFFVPRAAHGQGWNTTLLGTVGSAHYTQSVFVAGNYAYTAEDNVTLRVFNVSNPSAPVPVGIIDLPDPEDSHSIVVNGSYAYLANAGWVAGRNLQIFNISVPSSPTLVGFANNVPNEAAYDVALQGNFAYLAHSSAGLRIINISNPSSPVEVGSYATTGLAWGVAVSGNYAYVGCTDGRLVIVNVSNPAFPTYVSSLVSCTGFGAAALGIAVRGDYAYLAGGSCGFRVIDISNKLNPRQVDSIPVPPSGNATDVFLVSQYAYVSVGNAGFYVIEVTNPLDVNLRGYYDTPDPGSVRSVFGVGNLAYLADERGGMQIIRVDLPVGVDEDFDRVPSSFELSQNYPNPFNPVTNFQFSIAQRQLTVLKVYDVLGREVATLVNEVKQPGSYSAQWDASGMASGVYFCRLSAGSFAETRKLIVTK